MKLSHSSMSKFRRCKQRYKWQYVENLLEQPSAGQRRGTVGHHAVATWYKEYDEDVAMQSAADKMTQFEIEDGNDYSKDWSKFEKILPRYFNWSKENDFFDDVIAVEHKFDIELGKVAVLTGYIDAIVVDQGHQWLMEHKFLKSSSGAHISLDPQISIYVLAARELGFNIRGVMYNAVRMTIKGKAETEPVDRYLAYRNVEALDYIKQELILQAEEMMEFLENPPELVYRNTTRDCTWDCSFYNACLALNDDGDPYPVLNTMNKYIAEKRAGEPDE